MAEGGDEATQPEAGRAARSGVAAFFVGLGILLSRIAGLVRDRALAHYFGTSLYADVFSAGLRGPNLLQNLLGEGVLSASFIPAYSALLGQGRTQEAGRVAGAMFALLLAVVGAISVIGVAIAPLLVTILMPGFAGLRRELTIEVVRIMFPMAGLLALSAWALGVLNSHRRFFVPYFAPVLWNAAIIGALVAFGSRLDLAALVRATAYGALVGGGLQFLVQLPFVLRLDREIRLNSGRNLPAFKDAVRKAGPAILGRGVVQLSGYLDLVLASLLAVGALTRLRNAQTLYVLPVSLFAMSVAAAALPELARERTGALGALLERTVGAVRRVAFYVVPSFVAFVGIGDVLVAGLYQTGEFGAADVQIVWFVLIAYSLGLLASTTTRVYQSAFFALRDTATPARAALVRVAVAVTAGAVLMVQFEPVSVFGLAIPAGALAAYTAAGLPLGPVGLAGGAALGAWVEWFWLRRRLGVALGGVGAGVGRIGRMFIAALFAAAVARWLAGQVAAFDPLPSAAIVAALYGAVYLGLAALLRLEEARALGSAVARRIVRRH
jgi:putative peptidoglycan lipid II flippase